MKNFDVIIIGGGPGGYVCAIKAAQLGHTVACIDNSEFLGGTCLNVGCIPSKALLNITHKYSEAQVDFSKYGIEFDNIRFSLEKLMQKKLNIVSELGKGIEGLFRKNKITHFKGTGSFTSEKEVTIQYKDNKTETISGKNIVIATGSKPISLPGIGIDEDMIVSSTGALSFDNPPKKLAIVGGGVIGTEMGSIWKRLGSEVYVIEFAPKLLPGFDEDVSKDFKKIMEKQGLKFKLSSKVDSIDKKQSKLTLNISSAIDGSKEQLECDKALIAIGRKPCTENLGLEKIGINLDQRGTIEVDQNLMTNINGIYAIGDVIKGPMLAHKAEEEGIAVAEIISGQHGHVNYGAIPSVVYTHPEVASVGKTENELKDNNIEYKVGKFPMLANSRARANVETDGFVKILACKKTDEILGAQIIAANAGDLISEITLAMEFKAASEDIARTSHAHPSLSEATKEAALATFFKPIHM